MADSMTPAYYKWQWIWSLDGRIMTESSQKFYKEEDCRLDAEKAKPAYTTWDGPNSPTAQLRISSHLQDGTAFSFAEADVHEPLLQIQQRQLAVIQVTRKNLPISMLLADKYLFTEEEKKALQVCSFPETIADLMIRFLQNKTPTHFDIFIDVLKEAEAWEIRDKLLLLDTFFLSPRTELQLRLGKRGELYLSFVRDITRSRRRRISLHTQAWDNMTQHFSTIDQAIENKTEYLKIDIGCGKYCVIQTIRQTPMVGFHHLDGSGSLNPKKTMNFTTAEYQYFKLLSDVISESILSTKLTDDDQSSNTDNFGDDVVDTTHYKLYE